MDAGPRGEFTGLKQVLPRYWPFMSKGRLEMQGILVQHCWIQTEALSAIFVQCVVVAWSSGNMCLGGAVLLTSR